MANRTEIMNEIKIEQAALLQNPIPGFPLAPNPIQQQEIIRQSWIMSTNKIRKKYLQLLANKTGRNVILYYSGFMKIHNDFLELTIEDNDINGFMSAIYKLDKSKGLDLILHTPGGSISAAEAIVTYLRNIFGTNIRTIIPQIAMSAGTMIACAGKEILMGKHSCLGPTDPQFRGIPAHGVIEEFNTAMDEVLKNEKRILIWREIVSKYHPTFIGECNKAIELSNELVADWLATGMFAEDTNAHQKATNLVKKYLNNHKDSKTHDRHFNMERCKTFGLKIVEIESDNELQDLILSLHHATMISIDIIAPLKIIESQTNDPWLVLIQKN